jgi:hypothetical protein
MKTVGINNVQDNAVLAVDDKTYNCRGFGPTFDPQVFVVNIP